ncbi:MAG: Eco57I restriction-modification methylase domain-containing protein, partial [Christensenellaceae bacterium]|nr:Eco57I restriction-modification methylase domain-containing protein [Christensenellaceae bacterium]
YLKSEIERKFKANLLDYIRKLGVIQKSIYGVDIQTIAVEIARLRCFLSQIIEEDVLDNEENRGINPLPSLDFKFVIANTLIELDDSKQGSIFKDDTHMSELKKIREDYFNEDNNKRSELREKFESIQKKMLNKVVSDGQAGTKRYQQLLEWRPFTNTRSDWFDPEWMFGIEKFDIVIANPPYVHLEKMKESDIIPIIKSKKKPLYKTYTGRGDLYCLFYERGLNLLKKDGHLTYITSNKWMRSSYGAAVREYFLKYTNPISLIDLGPSIFNSAVVDTNIITLQKAKNARKTMVHSYKDDIKEGFELSNIKQNLVATNFRENETWIILQPIERSIKEKIDENGIPLEDWNIKINYGIKTGLNAAFVINQNKRDELIAKDPKSEDIIRPVLRGRDIKKDQYNWSGLYVIALVPAKNYNIDDYPAIKQYLLDFGYDKLKQTGEAGARANTCYKWFETQSAIAYWEDFNKPKIIYPETTTGAYFVIDKENYLIDKTCFMITGDNLEYLTSTLSSKLFEYAYKNIYASVVLGEKAYQYNRHAFSKLPIKLTQENKKLNDDEIFDLYGLNSKEREFVLMALKNNI